ncbi:hypothetical protein HanIR_Chr08g0358141 [Helianthus annuus]|nr:hypothetical protein HanIR_Chr08g0358141 [Helianthus annuus]
MERQFDRMAIRQMRYFSENKFTVGRSLDRMVFRSNGNPLELMIFENLIKSPSVEDPTSTSRSVV